MREGMLWFDNNHSRNLTQKIERAAIYYQERFGKRPTLCFVHPSMILNGPSTAEGIEVRTTNSVIENHFWLGEASK